MIALHWYDVMIPVGVLLALGGALVLFGRSIGAGYARMRRRMERDS